MGQGGLGRARTGAGAIGLLIALALTGSASAAAKDISVRPNRDNAISKAVNRADPGDRLVIHEGRYRESVEIDKRLRLVGAPNETRPTIDGRCKTNETVAAEHDGVFLRRVRVVGADVEYAVDFEGVHGGGIQDSVVRETCGTALYGVNVFQAGALNISGNVINGGFKDAGIYVGGITNTHSKTLTVSENESVANNRGIIIEDSIGPAADLRVIDNLLHDNTIGGEGAPAGIFVHNSDRVLFARNTADDNGEYGIQIDSGSDHNRFNNNRARSNGTRNFLDDGSGNCGSGNSFQLPHC